MHKIFIFAIALAIAVMAPTAHATAPTALTVASVVEAGVAISTAAADTSNGNSFDNTNGDVFVVLDNTHASATETFNIAVQNASVTIPGYGAMTKTNPLAITVAALSKKLVGPFSTRAYNDTSSLVQVTYSGSGTPRIQAFKVSGLQYSGN